MKYWNLKVVGLNGDIGSGTGDLRLLEGGQLAFGILSSLEHVGAVKIDTGTEFDGTEGGDVVGKDDRAAMIGVLHAASNFGGEIGIVAIGRFGVG
jgi:hypothetical protein